MHAKIDIYTFASLSKAQETLTYLWLTEAKVDSQNLTSNTNIYTNHRFANLTSIRSRTPMPTRENIGRDTYIPVEAREDDQERGVE